jgi:hypothetical protein
MSGELMAGVIGGTIGYSLADNRRGNAKVYDGKPVFFEMQAAYLGGYPHVPQADRFSSPSWVLVRETGVECRHGDRLHFLIPREVIRSARYEDKVSTVGGLSNLRWGVVLVEFVTDGGTIATVTFRIPGQVSQMKRAKQLVEAINALGHLSIGKSGKTIATQ